VSGLRAPASPGLQALDAIEAVLAAQRDAMVAGDPAAIEQASARLHALLADRSWRHDAALAAPDARRRLRAVLLAASVNAGVAARGDAHAARALAAIGVSPGLYTASGGWGGPTSGGRGVSA
jgi:uncharacterized protein (DUF2267 family)